ncbi:T20D4.11-like domain-containing protein [Caenorhabditis elegans]|uniref:T20D4.11-like domain-containing protein n=1 Tax=Caenorhabditis elegans TaxID=6239 RepID=O16450_CAEEL|nr:DUF19 domain-containing protein [Caenorhabditis elegans]CCD62991.1 DUF19 domain-containing protein [Caenorhabditis elegans]|eukprot:NP_504941.2 Uncharacterized protein CELE_C54F6.12 [Caenorhabditis elegans]
MKSNCCFIWICLALVTIPFYVYRAQTYIFHGKFSGSLDNCSSVFDKVHILIEQDLNDTERFLRTPQYYEQISNGCEKVLTCVKASTNLTDNLELDITSLCQFYLYYHNVFSKCAKKLMRRVGQNISCIDTIFNKSFEDKKSMCEGWDSAQDCLIKKISATCKLNSRVPMRHFSSLKEAMCTEIEEVQWLEGLTDF